MTIFTRKVTLFLSLLVLTQSSFSQDGPGGVQNTYGTSDLNLWLDADQITDIITGNNVSVWQDQSGYNNNASQTIGNNKPNWHENFVNGFPAISFDGEERLEGVFSGGLQAPVTVFAVAFFDSVNQGVGNWDYVFSVGSQGNPNSMLNIARNAGGPNVNRYINDDGQNINYGPTLTGLQWDIYNHNENSAAPFYTLNINGFGQVVDNFMTTALNTNMDFRVGDWADSPGGAYHLEGKIAEIITFKKQLNSAEMNIVTSYLGAKYNKVVNNDKYVGDDPVNNDNDRNVIGIGREIDGVNTVAEHSGIQISIDNNFDNGDYLMMGHAQKINAINTTDAMDVSGTLQARWDRAWWGDVTNTSTDIVVDLAFNIKKSGLGGVATGTLSNYKLLYRATNTGNWTIMGAASVLNDLEIEFHDITLINDGYYTIGTIDPINSPLGVSATESACKGPGGIGETDGTSNLRLWLNTQALKGGDTDPLVTYFDYSGYNNHATLFDIVNIPVIRTGVVNGNAAVAFDGNDYIEGSLGMNLSADATVISVGYFNNNQGPSENDYLISLGMPTNANEHLSISRRKSNPAADANKYYSWTGTTAILGPVINNMEWNIFYQEQLTTGNFHNLYLNGTSQIVASNPAAFAATTSTYRIGEWQNSTNSGLDGYSAETIIFDRQLNSAERNIINSYLGAKYNKTVAGDQYTGDDSANNDNDIFVAGIGTEADGANLCANSGGMIFRQNSNFDNGDYVVAGIPVDANSVNTSDIAEATSTITGRWERVWWIDVTDSNAPLTVDFSFDYSDAGGMGYPGPDSACYSLIYRSGTSGVWTIVATATSISGDQVHFTNVPVAQDGYYTLASCDVTINLLPVELLSFNASAMESSIVKLEWVTISEKDSRYFEIQKSKDGIQWEEVKQVLGAGYSTTRVHYEDFDETPYSGVSYYRLKQVDVNDNASFSEIRSVNFEGVDIVTSYPNPSTKYFQIMINSSVESTAVIGLYNNLGQVMKEERIKLVAGGVSKYIIDGRPFPSGAYTIRVQTEDGTYYDQMQIQVSK